MALLFSQLVNPPTQAGWLQFLLTALQGVGPVVQAPAPGTNQLAGTGQVGVSGPAQAEGPVVLKITTTGNAANSNPAFFQYSLDGGLTYHPPSPVSMASLGPGFTYAIPTVNVVVAFVNGAYTTAASGGFSFVLGETYQFQCNTPTFPVTNWPAIGVGNSLTQIDSQALSSLGIVQQQAIAGGFTQSWINPPLVDGVPTPPPDGWMDLLGQSFYNRERGKQLQTQGLATLTAASTAGPYTILAGQLFAAPPNGQFIFTNVTGGTLSQGGTLQLLWQAIAPGSAYNAVSSYGIGAPSNWLTNLLTPLAGVTLANPLQPVYPGSNAMAHAGAGSGTVNVAAASSAGASGEFQLLIQILTAGGLGTGTFKWSANGGTSFVGPITIPGGGVFGPAGATNCNFTFAGTFTAGDLYASSTSWITQRGVDQQSSQNYAVACQNQWATLAPAGPSQVYVVWAQAASPEVVDAIVIPDPVIANQVDITLIGANNGPVSSAAITAVYNYVKPRAPLTVQISVGTVSVLAVQVAAQYIVAQAQFRNTVIAAIQQGLTAYADTILPQGTVELSEVAAIIQEAPGVIEISPLSSLTLNGSAADIPLTANQVANLLAPLSTSFQFV